MPSRTGIILVIKKYGSGTNAAGGDDDAPGQHCHRRPRFYTNSKQAYFVYAGPTKSPGCHDARPAAPAPISTIRSRGSWQMESEQERFTHVMDLLEMEVAGLEQHEDLAMVDRIAKLVVDISTKISDAENKGRPYSFVHMGIFFSLSRPS